MNVQISRFPQELGARYSGVYQQQGRMLTDADWNALSEIVKARLNDALFDVIGSGSPEDRPIVSFDEDAGAHRITWGQAYVNGVPAKLTPDPAAVLDDPAGEAFEYEKQADFPSPPDLPAGAFLLYLDVWERTVTSFEDGGLRDAGLHGADTTARTRTMAQVKWGPAAGFDPEDPAQNPPIGGATLTATLRQPVEERDECEPCADEIEIPGRVGNYLFRLEVHAVAYDAGGAPERIVLKWSSENGAEVSTIGAEPPGFAVPDRVFEYFDGPGEDMVSETHLGWSHPDVLAGWSPRRGALVEGFPDSPVPGHSLVRRWDGWCELALDGGTWELTDGAEAPNGYDVGVRMSADSDADAHGHVGEGATVTLNLDALTLKLAIGAAPVLAGDHWLVTVREAAHEAGDEVATDAPPAGIRHHYMCLARVDGESVEPVNKGDCKRHGFPRLTDIEAEDVCYDNSACEMPDVRTVQDAIDHLCHARDLRWHNKHLHGWGIVCGLIVECGPDTVPRNGENEAERRLGVLTDGYALTCEGEDIVVEGWPVFDIVTLAEEHDAQSDEDILDANGNGALCLTLGLGADGPVVAAEPYKNADSFWAGVLDGTLLMDFYQHCVSDLIAALRKSFTFLEPDEIAALEGRNGELVSTERMRLTTLMNLLWQFVNPGNGAYVWLSKREHDILEELYLGLRILLQSRTFCGMFQADDFPDYPFEDDRIETWFGKGGHTRLKLHPGGERIYTYGGADNTINVYDVRKGALIEVIEMPAAEGAEVTAIAFTPEGDLLYAAASVRDQDSLFGTARIGRQTHDWARPMLVLCDILISEMEVSARDAGVLHAIGVGRGYFQLRPEQLRDQEKPSPDPIFAFNAVGSMAIDEKLGTAFATSNSNADADQDAYDEIRVIDLNIGEEVGEAPSLRLRDRRGRARKGSDRIALRPAAPGGGREDGDALLHVPVDPLTTGDDKAILTFAAPQGAGGETAPIAETLVEDTSVSLAHHPRASLLLATVEDGYRLQSITPDGSQEITHRIPAQIQPTDLAVHPESGAVHVLNFFSNTITAIPQNRLAPDDQFLDRLTAYRQAVILAFYALLGGLLQYLKDCFCHHLLVKCPDCGPDDKIYLACVEIRDRRVWNICNFSKRKYVKSFPTVDYWLSVIPIMPMIQKLVGDFCCSVLPNLFDQYRERIVPEQPAPQSGGRTTTSNRIKATTTRKTSQSLKRTDFRTLLRDQTKGVTLLGRMAGNVATDVVAPTGGRKGVGKQTFIDADVAAAQRELKESNIEVVEVARYDPKLADVHLQEYAGTPGRIAPNSRVKLYERDGKVAYYTIEKPTISAVTIDPEVERRIADLEERKRSVADISQEEAELTAMRDRKAEVETEVAELENRINTLREVRTAEEAQLREVDAQREALRGEMEELTAGIGAIAEEHKKLKAEIDRDRPVREVEGVTEEMDATLRNAGIRTVGELEAARAADLRRIGVVTRVAEGNQLIKNARNRIR